MRHELADLYQTPISEPAWWVARCTCGLSFTDYTRRTVLAALNGHLDESVGGAA